MWVVSENVPCATEKNVYSVVVGHNTRYLLSQFARRCGSTMVIFCGVDLILIVKN